MNASVTDLADELLLSYAQLGGINHLDGRNLPSKSAVSSVTADLLRLLFPGFFDEHIVHSSDLQISLVSLVDSLSHRLEDEIAKSLESAPPQGLERGAMRPLARELTPQFLSRLPAIRQQLSTDVRAAYDGDPAATSHEEIIVAYPCIEAIAVQRMAHELWLKHVPLLPRMMTEWAHSRTGIDLHPGARIGSHFFIDHGTGTIIGETTDIGNYVKIYHGVTLGAKSTSDVDQLRGKKRHPTIQDRVIIYPGATILGGDTVIGSGSTIGGNVVLNASVPPNSLVLLEGLTIKVLSKKQRSSHRAP